MKACVKYSTWNLLAVCDSADTTAREPESVGVKPAESKNWEELFYKSVGPVSSRVKRNQPLLNVFLLAKRVVAVR